MPEDVAQAIGKMQVSPGGAINSTDEIQGLSTAAVTAPPPVEMTWFFAPQSTPTAPLDLPQMHVISTEAQRRNPCIFNLTSPAHLRA